MIDFYNAFISYKHAPLDMKIAEHVQRSLEHFHVPHKMKGKAKHQKISRIFRDKDELPITSDLTETIIDALKKSEYLIVICSTNTKQSMWVKREIQMFLTTHTRDKILTVLCDGEPQDVIPEELTSVEKEYYDTATGFPHTVKIPIEPLSCDYRLPMKRADREELPRLAAALLGCSYDELQRRNRQYKMRRAAAVIGVAFAGLAAFGIYAAISRQQIKANYVESLRGRSINLAYESGQLIDNNKRTDAIHLALASLPQDKWDQMPVTAQGVRAITNATNAYNTGSGMSFTATWNYKTDFNIKEITLSENERYIAAFDKLGNVCCWDTATHAQIVKMDLGIIPIKVLFVDNETLVLIFDKQISAYNIPTGKNIWNFDDFKKYSSMFVDRIVCNNGSLYIVLDDKTIGQLSMRDGSIKRTFEPLKAFDGKSINNLTISPDGTKIAFLDNTYISDDALIHVLDIESGKQYTSPFTGEGLVSMKFSDENHLCLIANTDLFQTNAVDYGEFVYINTTTMVLFCYDSQLNKLWQNELKFSNIVSNPEIMSIPQRNAILFSAGDVAMVIEANSGNVLNEIRTPTPILDVQDYNSNGLPEFLCTGGQYVLQLSDKNNSIASVPLSCSNLFLGHISETLFVVKYGTNDIVCLDRYVKDNEWQPVAAPGNYYAGSNYFVECHDDKNLVVASSCNDTTKVRISVVDMKSAKLIFNEEVTPEEGFIPSIFKLENHNGEFYLYLGEACFHIDIKGGKTEKIDFETDSYGVKVVDGKIITYDTDDEEFTVTIRDMFTDEEQTLSLSGVTDFQTVYGEPVYIESINKIFLYMSDRVFIADLKNSELTEMSLPETFISHSQVFYVAASPDGSKILFSDGRTVMVTDSSFKELYSFTCECDRRRGAIFKDKVLYVAANSCLALYNSETGELLGKYDMDDSRANVATFEFDDKNHQLFIKTEDQLSIFDTNSWNEIASLSNVYCYDKNTDRFYVFSYKSQSECTMGYFKHYSLNDLIEKAKTYLNGHEIDDYTKRKYGL